MTVKAMGDTLYKEKEMFAASKLCDVEEQRLQERPYLDTITHEHVLVFQTVETEHIPQHLLIQDDLNPKPGTELFQASTCCQCRVMCS